MEWQTASKIIVCLLAIGILWILRSRAADKRQERARNALKRCHDAGGSNSQMMALAWPWNTWSGIRELVQWVRETHTADRAGALLALLRLRDLLKITGKLPDIQEEEFDSFIRTAAAALRDGDIEQWEFVRLMEVIEIRNRICGHDIRLWRPEWWKVLRGTQHRQIETLHEWEWDAILPHIDAIRRESAETFEWIVSKLVDARHFEWLLEAYAQNIPESVLQRLRMKIESNELWLRDDDRALDYLDVLTLLQDWDAIRNHVEQPRNASGSVRAAYIDRLFNHGQASLTPLQPAAASS